MYMKTHALQPDPEVAVADPAALQHYRDTGINATPPLVVPPLATGLLLAGRQGSEKDA